MSLIRPRAKAGPWLGFLLALGFGAVLLPIACFDLWMYDTVSDKAPVTLRTPSLGIGQGRSVLVPRGAPLDGAARAQLADYARGRRPPGVPLLIGLGLAYFGAGLMFTSYLRNFGYRGNLLRTQLALLGALAGFVVLAKVLLVYSSLSAFYVPIALLAIPVALFLDRQVAFATVVAAALLVGTLVPFDLTLSIVLLVQGFASVMAVRSVRRRRQMVVAGVVGGVAAAGMYVAVDFLISGQLPLDELTELYGSDLWGCIFGGLFGGIGAFALAEPIELLLGNVPRARLFELADLNSPLLKQIAKEAPGTWAHSLAMANLAEIAANAISANALLTRVGAYYHDLGKSVHPTYYIENLHPGERSPHEDMEPDTSADAIFSHCTEGVKMAREAGLPEAVIDFMHMHHGNGLLEYFWVKTQEAGNPKHLVEQDFRYPGVPPQTRETAILAICDAVEAASRTLKQPAEDRHIEQLVQRIIFGKMRLGQFDQSGLSVTDLRNIAAALIEALKNAFHARIEYQWQRDERREAAKEAAAAGPPPVPVQQANIVPLPTAQTAPRDRDPTHPIRLDSADAPRPYESNLSGSFTRIPVPIAPAKKKD
jgi:putative nucleotidyltransferase with HDIG domain